MLFAVVWHWWIGFFLSIGAFLTIAAIVIGYLVKVQSPRVQKKP